jgi:hypothetical protein
MAAGGILRPGDGIKPFHHIEPLEKTTINERPRWRGQNRPGDRVVASFLGRGKWIFFAFQGGRIEVAFCDQAMEENGTNWSRPSKTQQSTSDHVCAVEIDRGIAWRLCF